MNADFELIREIIAGQTNLFSQLIDKYKTMGIAIIKPIVKEEYKAKEILQDVFVIVYQKLHTFSFQSKFSTWFYTIAIRHTLKKIRVEKKYHYEEINSDEFAIPDLTAYEIMLNSIEKKDTKKLFKTF